MKCKINLFKRSVIISLIVLAAAGCKDRATSFYLPSQQDSFSGQIFYNNKVDILFVVDNSKSMLQYQQRLAAQVSKLISTLNSLKMDYRIAVTTSTMSTNTSLYPLSRMYVGSPSYLTSNNISQLSERIIVGESGSDVERSLDAMKYVTSTAYLSSIQSDFIRSDALLGIIFISDEPDSSGEFGNPASNDFINYLYARKPNFVSGARAWLANYIGVTTTQSCDILGGVATLGTEFIKLVDESKGVKSSICNADLSFAVSNIKARIIDQLTAYRFKSQPNKDSITVTIAGRTIHESAVDGWTLESETVTGKIHYLLRFHGAAIPAADENVDVRFKDNGAS